MEINAEYLSETDRIKHSINISTLEAVILTPADFDPSKETTLIFYLRQELLIAKYVNQQQISFNQWHDSGTIANPGSELKFRRRINKIRPAIPIILSKDERYNLILPATLLRGLI